MKTKEEVIKEAWGEHYDLVKDDLNDDGQICIDDIGFNVFDQIMILCNYDSVTELLTHPKLEGIENNNGWIKINSEEDFPKESGEYWVVHNNKISHRIIVKDSYIDKYTTHYQPIEKPKPPLY